MSRPCPSCGLHQCDGIECYLAEPEPAENTCTGCDQPVDEHGWCEGCSLTETLGDPLAGPRWSGSAPSPAVSAMRRPSTDAARSLANVLLDIRATETERAAADYQCRVLFPGPSHGDYVAACDRFARADDLMEVLRAEARDMLVRATGCTWDQISEGNL